MFDIFVTITGPGKAVPAMAADAAAGSDVRYRYRSVVHDSSAAAPAGPSPLGDLHPCHSPPQHCYQCMYFITFFHI